MAPAIESNDPAPSIVGCTITPTALLPQARVLAQSFLRHHPRATFAVLVSDGFSLENRFGDISLLSLDDVGLSKSDADRLPKIYFAPDVSLAVRPALLRHQLSSGADCVVYFDPTMEVFHSLKTSNSPFPTQHMLLAIRCASEGLADRIADENERLLREPGFAATGKQSSVFLEWWSAEVKADVAAERPLDRRLFDRIPAQFSAELLEGAGWNVGYWNVADRDLRAVGDRYEVDGAPLQFFNFSGYEINKPHLLSKHQGHEPRVRLSDSPPLAKLCREYRDKVLVAAAEEAQRYPHGFGFLPSGIKVDRHMHRLYFDAIARFNAGGGPKPPDPTTAQGEATFVKWLNQQMMEGKPEITRYMFAVHTARPDLQGAFPEPLGRDAAAFHQWFVSCGRCEEKVPAALMPSEAAEAALRPMAEPPPAPDAFIGPAVNIVGYFRAELGNGETARLLVSAFEAARIPFLTTVYDRTSSRQSHPFEVREATAADTDVDLICINADQLPALAESVRLPPERYRIGLWFWEVDEFPVEFDGAFDLLDEIWVASDYVAAAVRKVSPKPVFQIKLPIVQPLVSGAADRSVFGLPDRFCFLFNFDFLSVLERKNAVGLITAFTRAFQPGEGPILVIKSINGDLRVLESERLKFAASDHPDIRLMDGYLSAAENHALTALCDCYVSLHRAEGFGQTISEAMALGKPAIATAYSGNLDFMTADNSYLCPYFEREVGLGCDPYPATAHWAEPDLEAAAALMRHVYEHPDEARARGLRAAEEVQRSHSPSVAGKIIAERLGVIRRHRARRLTTATGAA